MKYIIGNILFLAAILLIIARFLSVWAGTPFPINLVTSNSMDPVLMKGDVVAWTPSRIEDIEVGDVVVYKSHINWPDEKLLVHRVTEIKHDTAGNILLETKGDANKYPDQEGPHIPEPYVREENLMGKTISIGNQPLKIPLVGMFGIWVSDGIESISQPSTSKESISYLGIFAPLTISAIILVVLIFIIPERAKTIKKKIKLYVFGPKQIGVKKTIIVFLIMYFVFFTLIHCFAFDSISASVGIEDKSPSSDVNFGRITQGKKSFPKDLPVFNPSVSTVKGVIYADGEIEDYISRDVFELPPGKSEQITLEASASNKTNNGSYSGDIMVYSSPFWVLFPDDFMQDLVNENPQMTIFYLDFLSALIFTTITAAIIISVTLISKAYNLLSIDLSWRHANRPILKKQTIKKMAHFKRNLRKNISKKIGWILKIDFTEIKNNKITSKNYFKPLLASLIIIPVSYTHLRAHET